VLDGAVEERFKVKIQKKIILLYFNFTDLVIGVI
jgi:hypothetical protein